MNAEGGPETRVMQTALDNPHLIEALIIKSVLRPSASAALVHAVARHAKWSCRKEIRAALLRTEYLSLARALEFSQEIPAAVAARTVKQFASTREDQRNCCARAGRTRLR